MISALSGTDGISPNASKAREHHPSAQLISLLLETAPALREIPSVPEKPKNGKRLGSHWRPLPP